jgi:HEPN domain-containing protein
MNVHPVDLIKNRKKSLSDVICNQYQQCAEKYLKALLTRYRIEFPKTHDLAELEDLVMGTDPDIRLISRFLVVLNPYGIDIRYPGVRATMDEAKEAVKAMKEVRRFVRAKLGLKTR